MNARTAALLLLAKMANVDGSVADEELQLLDELIAAEAAADGSPFPDARALLEAAEALRIEALASQVEAYADRFFIALRAYSMAHIDDNLDAREEALFDSLVGHLGIDAADLELIERCEQASQSETPPPPEPRLLELFSASSFAG